MNEDEVVKQEIINLFGKEAYAVTLNRKHIAEVAFNDAFKLELLNALIHPLTIKAANEWIQKQDAPYIIKEAALMFEAGAAANLDYVIGVFAPQNLRINRVMKRNHFTRDQVLERMNNQMDETIKMKLCDFVIINDEQQAILSQILLLHKQFLGR